MEEKKINLQNPAQLRRRVTDLEWEVGMLQRSNDRLVERVHEIVHKKSDQVVARKLCRIESFIYGSIGAGLTWLFLSAMADLASWI